jgi:putative RecB family exonuclease
MSALDRWSPSKIGAFRACPQAFAFRYVDGLDEPADRFMVRGTLVHEVCERLFDLAPSARSPVMAVALLHRLWERMVDCEPQLRALFADAADATEWLASAEVLVHTWFALESPPELDVAGRELFVQMQLPDGGVLAGIIDRLDRLADGTWRITDYKTSCAPAPGWERGEFFQLRFYAMVAMASLGVTVSRLRLVHLGQGGEILELPFGPDAIAGVDRQVTALTAAMRRAAASGRWHANVGRRCDWCAFKARCPAWALADDAPPTTAM